MKEISGDFVFVANVCPTMKLKTKGSQQCYKLWLVIDEERERKEHGQTNSTRKTTAGCFFCIQSLLGGKIGLANTLQLLYSLHYYLQQVTGPTENLCYWSKKFGRAIDPSPIKEVCINKPSTLLKNH